MRTIAISDIHGCYNELKELLLTLENNGEYNKDIDRLIFLGDYIDRGKDSRLVIKLIRDLQKNNKNVIALMGNHEDMLLNYYNHGDDCWIWNGSTNTMLSYKGYNKQFNSDMEWMKNLPLYYEDDYFVYVHAGVDVNKPLEEQDRNTLLWIREEFIYNPKEYHKQVVFGHTPTISFNNKTHRPIYTYTSNIDIDTGCVFGGALTALIIEDDNVVGFYQVEKEKSKTEIWD